MDDDGSSNSGDSELSVQDIPETEIGFDMAALLEPLIPPPPDIPVVQLQSVSFIFVPKLVLS
jgi:hypothetical protein